MKVNKKTIAGSIAGLALMVSAIGGGVALAQGPTTAPANPPVVQEKQESTNDQVQTPSYTGSISVDQTKTDGMTEADEAAALQGQAGITADQAKAAALAANPGTTATKVELDNENGVLVYSVQLDNGLDVKIDAGNQAVLHTEQVGNDNEGGQADNDGVQEQFESQGQPDDANEAPSVEDAVGK